MFEHEAKDVIQRVVEGMTLLVRKYQEFKFKNDMTRAEAHFTHAAEMEARHAFRAYMLISYHETNAAERAEELLTKEIEAAKKTIL